ncbi:MAG: DUF2142 domain-containing protein [Solobacterium sp.]|nr:DUF2142 domain-containing protein [Solobacterium sp.]
MVNKFLQSDRKKLVLLLITAVLTAVMTVFFRRNDISYRYSEKSISSGVISYANTDDEKTVETDLVLPWDNMHGFTFRISYAAKLPERERSFEITMKDADGSTAVHEEVTLAEMGYTGDNSNNGTFVIPFPDSLPAGTYTLLIQPHGFTASDKCAIAYMTDSEYSSPLRINGEDIAGSALYGSFIHGNSRTVRGSKYLLPPVCFILFWALYLDHCRKAKETQTPVSMKIRLRPLIAVMLGEALLLEYGYHTAIRNSENSLTAGNTKSAAYLDLNPGDSVSFEAECAERYFSGIALYMNPAYDSTLRMKMTISDAKDNVLDERVITSEDLISAKNTECRMFVLDKPVSASAGKTFHIRLQYESGRYRISLRQAKEGPVPYYEVLNKVYGFLKAYYLILAFVLLAGTVPVYLFADNDRTITAFAAAALILIGVISMVIKPMSVPDEYAHYDTAYRIANEFTGESSSFPSTLYKRRSDIYDNPGDRASVNKENLRWFRQDMKHLKAQDEEMVLIQGRDLRSDSSGFFYLPASAGILLGRALHLNYFLTFYLARMMNMLCSLGLICAAIRKMPFGRILPAVIALMPLGMQQLCGVTPDGLIFGFCFLLGAVSLRTMYEPERCTYTDMAVMVLIPALLTQCKGGAYLPLALLCIPALITLLQKRFSFSAKKIALLLIPAAVIVIAAVGYRYRYAFMYKLFASQDQTYSQRLGTDLYSGSWLLSHPLKFLRILEGTVYTQFPTQLASLFGSVLTWTGSIKLNAVVQYLYLSILLAAVFLRGGETYRLNTRRRILLLVSCLLCFAAAAYAMLTGWTRLGTEYISGLQMRYYIPFLPMLLVCVPSLIKTKDSVISESFIIKALYFAGVLAFTVMITGTIV